MHVSVAAYGTLDAAAADWADLGLDTLVETDIVDALLIERRNDRVVTVHRYSAKYWADGSVASALVGLFWPPALLDGAIAGGVSGRVLTFVSKGLSRDAVNEFSRVMTSERFVIVLICERRTRPTTTAYEARALCVARLPIRGTAHDLRHAVEADYADD